MSHSLTSYGQDAVFKGIAGLLCIAEVVYRIANFDEINHRYDSMSDAVIDWTKLNLLVPLCELAIVQLLGAALAFYCLSYKHPTALPPQAKQWHQGAVEYAFK